MSIPKILLIDEVLAVGDLAFQEKCLARIDAFKTAGCAIVLISHDMSQVRQFCDRAIWLDAGHIRAVGKPDAVVEAYETAAHNAAAASQAAVSEPGDGPNRFGTKEAVISDFELTDPAGRPLTAIRSGDGMILRFRLTTKVPTELHLSVSIADSSGRLCFDANSEGDQIEMPTVAGGISLAIHLDRLDLAPGTYFISVGAWHKDWSGAYDMHMDAYPFEVTGGPKLLGVLAPPRRWQAIQD